MSSSENLGSEVFRVPNLLSISSYTFIFLWKQMPQSKLELKYSDGLGILLVTAEVKMYCFFFFIFSFFLSFISFPVSTWMRGRGFFLLLFFFSSRFRKININYHPWESCPFFSLFYSYSLISTQANTENKQRKRKRKGTKSRLLLLGFRITTSKKISWKTQLSNKLSSQWRSCIKLSSGINRRFKPTCE